MVWSEGSCQKASHTGNRTRTSLLLRDHPLHSFFSPGILPLLSLPMHGLYRDCQTQEPLWARARAGIYRDASDVLHRFAGRIIKRGNGVGRTERESRRRMLGPSKCMQLSIMPSCCCATTPQSLRCVEPLLRQDLVLKFVENRSRHVIKNNIYAN